MKAKLKSYLMDIVVALISISYVAIQFVVLKPTGLTIGEVIAKCSFGVVFGILIKQGLGENGFIKGYNSSEWNEEKEKYNNQCNNAIQYMDKLDDFYERKRIEKTKKYRFSHLQAVRLKYAMFFNENGEYIEHDIISAKKFERLKRKNPDFKLGENQIALTFKQRQELKKCCKVRIHLLNLFSEYDNDVSNDTKREKTDKDQRTRMLTKNLVNVLVCSVVGVYFVPDIVELNWGGIIMAIGQVAIWLGTGISQLYMNYNYVVNEKISKLKQKKQDITEFIILCERNKNNENLVKEQ